MVSGGIALLLLPVPYVADPLCWFCRGGMAVQQSPPMCARCQAPRRACSGTGSLSAPNLATITQANQKIRPYNGERIKTPGIYEFVPFDIYHGDLCDGLSVSGSTLTDAAQHLPGAGLRAPLQQPGPGAARGQRRDGVRPAGPLLHR
jgi:hypothetical protein